MKDRKICIVCLEKFIRSSVEIVFALDELSAEFLDHPLQTFLSSLPNSICKQSIPFSNSSRLMLSVGRRLHRTTLEYFARLEGGKPFPVKHTAICDLMEAISIQSQTRGKFILQQSELLASVRQRSTTLLEIIEETAGNSRIVARLGELEKRQKALYGQKESIQQRMHEIEMFVQANEEIMEAFEKRKEMTKEQEEMEQRVKMNEVKEVVLSFLLGCISLKEMEEDWANGERQREELEEEEGEEEKILREINERIRETGRRKQNEEKAVEGKTEELSKLREQIRKLKRTMEMEREKVTKLERMKEDLQTKKESIEKEVCLDG